MCENFNFSLKYIIKYLNLKNKAEKEKNESDEQFQDRIINEFYEKESTKMKKKIQQFYEILSNQKNNNEIIDYLQLEFQTLCKLRSYIFYEKKFTLYNLSHQLLLFPMKYLHIIINNYDEHYFPLKNMNNNYSYKLEYNNNFIRIQINRIIEEIFKGFMNVSVFSFKGAAEGTFLELKIDEIFRNNSSSSSQPFGLSEIECRYLFSLVSKTKNSSETIKKHRIEETKMIFFGKNNYNILIDDIDDDKLDKEHFILKKNYYYFSQVSLTGKAFDMCIIAREGENSFRLYLFQISKNKTDELGSKFYYLNQADNVAENLKSIYDIDCTNRYLIFILPKGSNNTDFVTKLDFNFFTYIFFDIFTNEFSNKNNEKILTLNFNEALLDEKIKTDFLDYEKIQLSYTIWTNSMKAYINKKKIDDKTFYEIYMNKFKKENIYSHIKLTLPKSLNDSILENVIHEKNGILKFIGNCKYKNIKNIKAIHKMIILFKKDEKIYINYDALYLINKEKKKNKYSFKIVDENEIQINEKLELEEVSLVNIKRNTTKKYIKIQLVDLKNKIYNEKCFCYLIINEKMLETFYHWWH